MFTGKFCLMKEIARRSEILKLFTDDLFSLLSIFHTGNVTLFFSCACFFPDSVPANTPSLIWMKGKYWWNNGAQWQR